MSLKSYWDTAFRTFKEIWVTDVFEYFLVLVFPLKIQMLTLALVCHILLSLDRILTKFVFVALLGGKINLRI